MSAPSVAEGALVDALARAVAERYLVTVKAQDRLDALDGRTGALASEELRDEGAASAIAAELIGELLRIVSDERIGPLLCAVLERPATVRSLAGRADVTRLAVARRVGELAATGLVERDPSSDVVSATPLATALVALVDALTSGAAAALRAKAR